MLNHLRPNPKAPTGRTQKKNTSWCRSDRSPHPPRWKWPVASTRRSARSSRPRPVLSSDRDGRTTGAPGGGTAEGVGPLGGTIREDTQKPPAQSARRARRGRRAQSHLPKPEGGSYTPDTGSNHTECTHVGPRCSSLDQRLAVASPILHPQRLNKRLPFKTLPTIRNDGHSCVIKTCAEDSCAFVLRKPQRVQVPLKRMFLRGD